MKLYYVPHPYDYHQSGAYVIMAENKREALKKLKASTLIDEHTKIDDIEALKEDIYVDGGCDC